MGFGIGLCGCDDLSLPFHRESAEVKGPEANYVKLSNRIEKLQSSVRDHVGVWRNTTPDYGESESRWCSTHRAFEASHARV